MGNGTGEGTHQRVRSPGLGRGAVTVAVVGLGAAIGPLDSSVNIAFPDITESFQKPLGAIQWVIICYVLTYASLLLNFGRWADIVGHRRIFVVGLLSSAVGLTACGFAPSYEWLLLARAVQGVGIGLVLATGPALVTLSFPDETRGRALGMYAMFITSAAAAGPLLGGVLVSTWGWPGVFWFRVPIALVVAVLVLLVVREPSSKRTEQRFDLGGALLLTLALTSTLLAVNRVSALGIYAPSTLGLLIVSLFSVTGFIVWERRCASPVIEMALFARRQFSVANGANVLAQMSAFMVLLLGPYFLVRFADGDVGYAGLLLGISPIGGAVAAAAAGHLLGRSSAWALSCVGLSMMSVGLMGVSMWEPQASTIYIVWPLVINGVGVGLFQVANMDYVIGSVPRSQHGVAGALTMLTRTVGVVCGATFGAILFTELGGQVSGGDILHAAFMPAFSTVFTLAACVSAGALLLMLAAGRESQ
jgi:EmrB/QacA subfamily drug resistance transporter